jgi:hypothetical protein
MWKKLGMLTAIAAVSVCCFAQFANARDYMFIDQGTGQYALNAPPMQTMQYQQPQYQMQYQQSPVMQMQYGTAMYSTSTPVMMRVRQRRRAVVPVVVPASSVAGYGSYGNYSGYGAYGSYGAACVASPYCTGPNCVPASAFYPQSSAYVPRVTNVAAGSCSCCINGVCTCGDNCVCAQKSRQQQPPAPNDSGTYSAPKPQAN